MPNTIPGCKRVNLTIEAELHEAACKQIKAMCIPDGFSGATARLWIAQIKTPNKKLARVPRLLHAK